MLIKALCDYADKQESSIPDGFEKHIVHFRILLAPDGRLVEIIDQREQKLNVILPTRKSKSSTSSEIIEHRSKYIFGMINGKNGLEIVKNKKGENACFNEFYKTNYEFLKDIDSDIAKAVVAFIKKWKPEDELNNPVLLSIKAGDFNTLWFDFSLAGHPEITLENDEKVKNKYITQYVLDEKSDKPYETGVCGILGKKLPIADLHDKINFHGGKCPLISMNEPAYRSYGKDDSSNSNISVNAMKKYTVTLNNLLKDEKHFTFIEDMVVLFFAIKKDDSLESGFFTSMLGSNNDKAMDQNLAKIMEYAKKGFTTDKESIDFMMSSNSTTFYIIGYTQTKSRISTKLFYKGNFGNMLNNLIKHQRDLMINEKNNKPICFKEERNKQSIAKELKSPKSAKDKVPASLISAIMLAALNNTKYPDALLSTVIRRVKTDSDDDKNQFIKLNDTRAGIIKACLNRKNNKEEFTLAWNDENKNPAYLCGGLFAVYEKIQQESSGGNLNRTIKDAYFASACSRPASVFPKLAKLSQNHMRKLGEGKQIYYNRLIGSVCDGFDGEYPQTLSLDDQGRFIIGYYQMNKKLYTSEKSE